MSEFVDTYGWNGGLAAPRSFGQRLQAPQQPRYAVWSPMLGYDSVSLLEAVDSFQARRAFAEAHPGMEVIEVCARRVDLIDANFRAQFPTFALPVDLPRR